MTEEEKFIRYKIEESTRLIEASSYIGNKKAYAKERTQFKCVLNLIQKQQEMIDLLATELANNMDVCELAEENNINLECENRCKIGIEKECWLKYFEKKVEDK